MCIRDRSSPSLVGHFQCEGPQGDVSIVNDLVFVSVDTPQPSSECNDLDEANEDPPWEGIRIVDISNPATPTQIAAVKTDCGSHTHTLVPDRDHRDPETGEPSPRVLVYVLSYPLTPNLNAPECNVAQHRKISVVEVPLDDPTSARVVSTPDVSPASGNTVTS